MKALPALLALAATAQAQIPSPVVVPAPVQPQAPAVSSPASLAQSNQALLNQINSTLQTRAFEHQMLTLPLQQPAQPVFINAAPVIRVK